MRSSCLLGDWFQRLETGSAGRPAGPSSDVLSDGSQHFNELLELFFGELPKRTPLLRRHFFVDFSKKLVSFVRQECANHPAVLSRALTGDVARLFHPRSEEHTSELQSRGHLVCR